MTKDILINISGLQMDVDPNDPIEMMTTGAYYLRNGKHYILYDELSEDNEIVKNVIKIGPKSVELTRKGGQSSHMVFEEGKENLSYYDTPFGSLLMGVNTSNIDWIEEEEQMHLNFPHELGLILGYPLCDVIGFIKNNGQNCLYCSYWKVYDNLSQTKKVFEVYDKVRFQMVKLVEYGKSFKELVDMYTNYQVPRYA